MSDVTRILNAIDAGDPQAAEQLLPLVYDELRRLGAARCPRPNARTVELHEVRPYTAPTMIVRQCNA